MRKNGIVLVVLSAAVLMGTALSFFALRESGPGDVSEMQPSAKPEMPPLRELSAQRYAFRQESPELIRTENPAQSYSVTFGAEGVEVSPKNASLRMKAVSWGYAGEHRELSPVTPRINKDRIHYEYPGMTEWYVNSRQGLEQGFTIASRLDNPSHAKDLEVRLELNNGWTPVVHSDGSGVMLFNSDRQTSMNYDHLKVVDARGVELAARLSAQEVADAGHHLIISVDDSQAAYPIVIDPIISASSAGDGAPDDEFGFSVSLDGDTVAVGAPGDDIGVNSNQGSVYVFTRDGSTWSLQGKVTTANGNSNVRFGHSVALKGDTLAIGAPGTNSQQGVTHIFSRNSSVWTQSSVVNSGGDVAGETFGWCVSLTSTTLAVGAPLHITESANVGAVYVYVSAGQGQGFSLQKKLLASDRAAGAHFGTSVAVDADTVIAGATKTLQSAGAAYAFTRSGIVWTQQAILTPNSSSLDDGYGAAVAISGNTAIVGAPRSDLSATNAGAAFVFTRTGNNWTQQDRLTDPDAAANDALGTAISVEADLAVVGAPGADISGRDGQGAAYVFLRTGSTWAQEQKVTSDNGTAGDQFGGSVSLSGSTLVTGASFRTVLGNAGQGAAFVHLRTGNSWSQEAALDSGKGLPNIHFGTSVSLNGTTMAIGAPDESDAGGSGQGAVYVFVQSGNNWNLQARLIASNGTAGAQFGWSVSLENDTLVVGAAGGNTAYAFIRSGATWSQQAILTATEVAPGDTFGTCVALSGNFAIVGAPLHAVGGKIAQGAAYVFFRSGNAWAEQQQILSSDGAAGDHFGSAVVLKGDIAIIGAPTADLPGTADCGGGYAFVRSANTFSQQSRLNATGPAAGDQLGFSVALSGTTALLGAPYRDQTLAPDAGSVFAFTQNGITWPQTGELIPSDGKQNDKFGWSVALDGEYALVGIPYETQDGFDPAPGSAQFFNHTAGSWTNESKKLPTAPEIGNLFGFSVAVSGTSGVVGIPLADVSGNAEQGAVETVDLPAINRKPTLNPIGDKSIDEGSTLTFTVAGNDPDGDTLEFALEAGAPEGAEIDAVTGVFTYTAVDGLASFPVTFRVRETNRFPNLSATETIMLVVLNVPPTIEIDGQLSAAATVPYILTIGEIEDPGDDTATAVSIDWGDGAASEPANTPGDYTHTYADGSIAGIPRTIRVAVTDEDGTVPAAATLQIRVYAGPPTIQMQGVSTSAEGSAYTLTLTNPVDPDGVITGGVIHWGDNQTTQYTGPKAYTHTYMDGGKNGTQRTISVDLTDARGTFEDASSKKITITNVAPTVQISGNATANENQPYTLIVAAPSDPGSDTVSGGMIHWGDNTNSAYASPGTYSHTYASALAGNNVTITIDLSDEDGTYLALAAKTIGVLHVNRPPVAQDGILAVTGTVTTTGTLKGSDADLDPITFIITQQPLKGVVTITNAATGAYEYKATNNVSGLDQFLFKVNDGVADSNEAAVLITLQKANSAPVLLSPARATPGTVELGKPITFSVVASDVDGDTLTYSWDFGDSSQLGTGAVVNHTYAAVGTYTAQVTVSDGKNPSVSSTVQVTVNPAVSNLPLVVSKLQIKLNFAKSGADSITFSGTLPLADGFSFAGKTCVMDVGGVQKTLTLDAKGKSTPKGVDTLTIAKPKGGVAKYSVKLTKGTFAAALAANSGLTNENLSKVTRTVVVKITFDGKTYQKSQQVLYTAKAGKTGTATSVKGQ